MQNKYCLSCGMPIQGGAADTSGKYCQYCTDDNGNLKLREEVKAGITQWLQSITPEDTNADYEKRAEYYLKSMPAWAE
ncbi:MAG TPA: zinc ribbon domain-containing protein [Halanaerobiales bacterium]|nr:zinc ribbon domain-containing protein [Halanaerobiales bacterium]